MKKLFAVAAMTIATTSVSSAMASGDMFVGAEFGKAKYEFGGEKQKESQYGLRFGSYINDNVRVYANLNQGKGDATSTEGNIKSNGKFTSRQLTVSADYVFETGYPVKPFAGATLGTNWAEISGQSKVGSTTLIDDKKSNFALAYGAQVGVMGQFGQFDVELGYRYLKHNNKMTFKQNGVEAETKLKDSKTPYLSVSYKF